MLGRIALGQSGKTLAPVGKGLHEGRQAGNGRHRHVEAQAPECGEADVVVGASASARTVRR